MFFYHEVDNSVILNPILMSLPFQLNDPSPDPWANLRTFTDARIAIGRTGTAEPLRASLDFKLAHAHARDAVHSALDLDKLRAQFQTFQLPVLTLHSQAKDRLTYIQRPDFGRCLDVVSHNELATLSTQAQTSARLNACDVALIFADGLSATAINEHAFPLLQLLIPRLQNLNLKIAPLSIIEQGRVAIGDEVGALLNAQLAVIFIGERPGLSSPDSMGAYLTYAPKIGTTDEARNCVSNIRTRGLVYAAAVEKIVYLIEASLRLKLTGVGLKDMETGANNYSTLAF